MNKPLLVAIVGPTASGKTDLSLRIAEHIPLTVISADSRQVFRRLDIGTAKPSRDQLDRVPHRCIDIVEPEGEYNAAQFAEDALRDVDEVIRSGQLPLVVGGSGLYVKALLEGLVSLPGKDEEIRRLLQEKFDEEGEEQLRKELASVDAEAERNIEAGKPRRLIRALEVYYLTGKPLSAHHRQTTLERPFRAVIIGLSMQREDLYEIINQRTMDMISQGFVDEVRTILGDGVPRTAQALNTVGYKEAVQFIDGEISEEQMTGSIQQATRRFAKRQMTWFRGEAGIEWIEMTRSRSRGDVAAEVCNLILREQKK